MPSFPRWFISLFKYLTLYLNVEFVEFWIITRKVKIYNLTLGHIQVSLRNFIVIKLCPILPQVSWKRPILAFFFNKVFSKNRPWTRVFVVQRFNLIPLALLTRGLNVWNCEICSFWNIQKGIYATIMIAWKIFDYQIINARYFPCLDHPLHF